MKKALSLILALVMCLSLCACSKTTTGFSELKVGDTASGKLFDITIQSVETVDKIKNGFVKHVWSPVEDTTYRDITAKEGYTIVKITYSYKYKGKEKGDFKFELSLDYDDGYVFDSFGGHALPALDNTIKVGFEEYYDTGTLGSFSIDDPLTFAGGEGHKYIFVNNEVLSDTDKALVLKVDVPTSAWAYSVDEFGVDYGVLSPQSEPETFIYNLR